MSPSIFSLDGHKNNKRGGIQLEARKIHDRELCQLVLLQYRVMPLAWTLLLLESRNASFKFYATQGLSLILFPSESVIFSLTRNILTMGQGRREMDMRERCVFFLFCKSREGKTPAQKCSVQCATNLLRFIVHWSARSCASLFVNLSWNKISPGPTSANTSDYEHFSWLLWTNTFRARRFFYCRKYSLHSSFFALLGYYLFSW